MNYYNCKHCNRTIQRDSIKQWIKSYCATTGKNTRLILIKENNKTTTQKA